jgi:hypothetical protein
MLGFMHLSAASRRLDRIHIAQAGIASRPLSSSRIYPAPAQTHHHQKRSIDLADRRSAAQTTVEKRFCKISGAFALLNCTLAIACGHVPRIGPRPVPPTAWSYDT